jgi:AcrR family transcriptional regulator
MTMPSSTSDRRHRSDGARSHAAILEAATRLASTRGLDRLSIGELADEVGISKSGLYAHFGSKEELQLATIDAAEEIFNRVVVAPSDAARPGMAAVLVLCDAFLDHLRDKVFPGGCFFACASAEMHARPGPVKDRIAEFDGRWRRRFKRHLETARSDGDLPAGEDLDALVFDLDALLYYAHGAFSFRDDPAVLEQARDAVRRRLRAA